LLARAALGFGGRWYDAGRADEPLIAVLEEALLALPPGDSHLRARLLARLADALHFVDDGTRTEELSHNAVAMARRTRDTHALMVALAGRHTALLHIEHLPERLEVGKEWLELSEARQHRDVTAQALHWRVYDLCEFGDLEQAGEARERLQALADELRQPLYQHFAAAWEAKWLEMAGDFDAAERKAHESFERAQEANAAYAKSNYAGQLFGLRRDQGRLGGLSPVVKPLIGDDPHLAVWRTGLVLAHLESGDKERATSELARFSADDFASVPKDLFWLGATCLLSESSAALDDRETSATLRRLLTPYAEYNAQIGLAVAVGPVHRFLGLLAAVLGDADAAIDHFHRALDWSARNRAVTAEAHVQCELGELLLRHEAPPERACELLRCSRDTAARLGMKPLKERAEALLR
jgi:tetratricopeptide (TPR) repeat protein